MTDNQIAILSKQIEFQANSIKTKNGFDLIKDIMETCLVLLTQADKEEKFDEYKPVEQDYLMDQYREVARSVSQYIKRIGLDMVDDEIILGSSERIAKLEQTRNKLALDKQAQIENAKRLENDIAAIKSSIEEQENIIRELKATKEGLENSLENYSPDKIEALKKENELIFLQYNEKKSEFDNLSEQRKEAESKNNEIQLKIDALPDELKTLHEEMDYLKTRYQEISQAEETCNLDKQTLLKDKIEEIEKQLSVDKEVFGELEKRRDELEKEKIIYDENEERLVTSGIDLILKYTKELRPKLEKHKAVLEKIDSDYNELRDSYNRCLKLREQYDDYFQNDMTPLEKLIEAVDKEGNNNLKETLRIEQITEIKDTFSTIKQNLDKLDGVLKKARNAYGLDKLSFKERGVGHTQII